MTTFDPTSVGDGLLQDATTRWSVEDVAAAHAEIDAIRGSGPRAASGHAQYAADPALRASRGADTAAGHPAPGADAARRTVSGRYRSQGDIQLELRVDVDGIRPVRRLSGDFFRRSGGTVTYLGSFVVHAPAITVTDLQVTVEGEGVYTIQTGSPRLRVTIPRVPQFMARAAATAQFMNPSGASGASYVCPFESEFFRSVEFEQDFVQNVTPFESYDTGLLTSGGPARVLTVMAAFAEAGVEMVPTGASNQVALDLAGPDAVWSRSEMHAAMVAQFSRWEDLPGWRVWLLAATQDEEGNRGIMFDLEGSQRQGCAVFHDIIGGSTNEIIRAQLRTYVHELGHCFNLYHSHQKEYTTPPQPNRMDALSWMHYPHYYQSGAGSGATTYWRFFPFQFDDLEVIHLRHAFRSDIIMGGNPFGSGAAEIDPLKFADPIHDGSGLRLTIAAPRSLALGEPLVAEIVLESTDTRGKIVNQRLHPNTSYVQFGILKPGGKTVVYRPFIQSCAEPELITLGGDASAVKDSAYIGYGQDGFYFDAPGVYHLRAVYHAPEGSQVFSNTLKVRVRSPSDQTENELADLFLGDEQGQLLYVLGSDSPFLSDGNDAFDLVIDKYGAHPLAVYAKLVKGVNASRAFKVITDYKVQVRPAKNHESEELLADVVRAALPDGGGQKAGFDPTSDVNLDDVTLLQVMSRLTHVQTRAGDMEKARATAQLMMAQARKAPGRVETLVSEQAQPYLTEDGAASNGKDRGGTAPVRRRKT